MINEVWRIESKESISEPGEPAEPKRDDPGTARAKMIKRKEDAWKLTPRRGGGRRASRVDPPPAQRDAGGDDGPDPGTAREGMIRRKEEAWKLTPRRRP